MGDIRWLGITDNSFYFARYGKSGAIWRVSLSGGSIELFAELGEDWGYQIEPPLVSSPNGLLLNGQRQTENLVARPATIVISEEGTVRDLPYPEGSSAWPQLTPTGVVHTVRVAELEPAVDEKEPDAEAMSDEAATGVEDDSDYSELAMWLSPLDGGKATEFWPDRPAAAKPGHVESDGRDGWFVTATELFNDGLRHDTLWHVRADVESRRLACNPKPETSRIQTESRTGNAFAFGDGFVYLVSGSAQSEFWELVQISYQPPGEQP
jgi:hypothetical protein